MDLSRNSKGIWIVLSFASPIIHRLEQTNNNHNKSTESAREIESVTTHNNHFLSSSLSVLLGQNSEMDRKRPMKYRIHIHSGRGGRNCVVGLTSDPWWCKDVAADGSPLRNAAIFYIFLGSGKSAWPKRNSMRCELVCARRKKLSRTELREENGQQSSSVSLASAENKKFHLRVDFPIGPAFPAPQPHKALFLARKTTTEHTTMDLLAAEGNFIYIVNSECCLCDALFKQDKSDIFV